LSNGWTRLSGLSTSVMAGLDLGLTRPSTSLSLKRKQDVDHRNKPGDDGLVIISNSAKPPHSRGMICPSFATSSGPRKRRAQESRMLCAPAGVPVLTLRTRGETGRMSNPHTSLASKESRTRVSTPQVRRSDPAFPARLVFTVFFALSLVIGLSCHHHGCDAQASSPI
jgi:hypothetical protein